MLWLEKSMDRSILLILSPLLRAISVLRKSCASLGKIRRVAAIVLAGAGALAVVSGASHSVFWNATARAQAPAAAMPHINQLWQEQKQRLASALDALQPRVAGRANVYAVAVAAQGTQQLFSREAQLALEVAAARFGGNFRGGVLLSNALPDLLSHPLATQDNVAAAARGIGGRIDPAQDLVVVYLTSHGSPEGWLSTNLPSQATFPPINAGSLAAALSQAGIRRRVVIVSACFSGSWIPALASNDTIVITAAAKDRSSFGCDERRRLTYFGEAFLEGPLARGASLREAFEKARGTVASWEESQRVMPSLPEASVGRNLQALWTERAPPRK
jgi:hypothetical protein